MHKTQRKILDLSEKHSLNKLSYRKIGQLLGGEHPQTVKYHMEKLEDSGLIKTSTSLDFLNEFSEILKKQPHLIEVPVLGQADCGIAEAIAEQKIEGYIRVSEGIVKKFRSLFALRAKGDSMNNAFINGNSIEDGDYVLVDYSNNEPRNGDYVVSVMNDCANIKIFFQDKKTKRVHLLSKSKQQFPPIVIDADEDFYISGKVIDVIKVSH